MRRALQSRKFLALLGAVITTTGIQYLGLSEETALKVSDGIVKMVMMYLGLQGGVDIAERVSLKPKAKPKKPKR